MCLLEGKTETEPRASGVAFAIRNDIASSLTSLPKGISDRIMTLRLSLANKTHLTLISVHAPTMTHPDEEREAFYSCLREAIHSVPSKDKLLLLGDFNARVSRNKHAWPGVLGSHGHGKENSNGLLLLSLCAEENLVITNTVFKHKDITRSLGCTQDRSTGTCSTTSSPGTRTLARFLTPEQ